MKGGPATAHLGHHCEVCRARTVLTPSTLRGWYRGRLTGFCLRHFPDDWPDGEALHYARRRREMAIQRGRLRPEDIVPADGTEAAPGAVGADSRRRAGDGAATAAPANGVRRAPRRPAPAGAAERQGSLL